MGKFTLWPWLTGGRPMVKVRYVFEDIIRGEPVYLWQDKRGRYWYATNAWAWFRVKPESQALLP